MILDEKMKTKKQKKVDSDGPKKKKVKFAAEPDTSKDTIKENKKPKDKKGNDDKKKSLKNKIAQKKKDFTDKIGKVGAKKAEDPKTKAEIKEKKKKLKEERRKKEKDENVFDIGVKAKQGNIKKLIKF